MKVKKEKRYNGEEFQFIFRFAIGFDAIVTVTRVSDWIKTAAKRRQRAEKGQVRHGKRRIRLKDQLNYLGRVAAIATTYNKHIIFTRNVAIRDRDCWLHLQELERYVF